MRERAPEFLRMRMETLDRTPLPDTSPGFRFGRGWITAMIHAAIFVMVMNTVVAGAAPPEGPTNLRVNDAVNPVGVGATPYFGWHVNDADPDEIQTRFHVLVASSESKLAADQGDVWDSGPVTGSSQNHVAFAGDRLGSDRKYFWKVRTWDRDGNAGAWSEPGTFVVGLLDNSQWDGAKWIRRETSDEDDYTYSRKATTLPARTVERATLYVSGTHKYELYFNDTLVGKGPAYHHPQYQYYNAYDVTSLVHPGAVNQFAILNHWFGGGQGRPAGDRGMIMKAIIHYTDGTRTEIGTDGTWRVKAAESWVGPRTQRNNGEGVGFIDRIDARLLTPDWHSAGFDDSGWADATVIGPQPNSTWSGILSPDLTRIEEAVIVPQSITDKGNGTYVIDLGKVYAGTPRIRFSGGTSGDEITMRGGYELNSSGLIPKDTLSQSTNMEYRAFLDGGAFTFAPIEYLGMRYFQIDNSPMPLTAENFSFVVRHSAMDSDASSFESPNATLNAVWALMKHSLFTCAQEEFVDTPTREKGGFLGDAAIQSTVAMPAMNERLLTRRALHEFLQSMDHHWSKPADRGRMNAVYPNDDGGRDIPDFTQAYAIWVWEYFMETGDRDFLSTSCPKLKEIAGYLDRHTDGETGLIRNLTGGSGKYEFGIIDWPETMRFGYDMNTDTRTVINGWALADYRLVAAIAEVLGHTADRDLYLQRAKSIETAINKWLINSDGLYVDGLRSDGTQSPHVSQHANMFPLALGIVPPDSESKVVAKVKEMEMSVGMVTLPWLIRAIGEANEGEHLIELFTNESWYGWARCLALGATATWESWDADTTGQSLSHGWGAAGLDGYVRYILGIRPIKPQYEEVQIRPLDFGSKLSAAKGTISTDRGEISVDWKSGNNSYTLKVRLPVNTTARISVPRGDGNSPVVHLDGVTVEGIEEGDWITVPGVGSGTHTVVRFDSPLSSQRTQ